MPLRNKTSDLKYLCVQSIAQNVISHSHAFKNSAFDEQLQCNYRTFQKLFGEILLEKLRQICQSHVRPSSSKIRCFAESLSLGKLKCFGKNWSQNDLKVCLDFIFNEHIKRIDLNCPCGSRSQMTDGLTSHILSKCRDPEDLDLHRSNLNESRFLDVVPHWHNLVNLNLSQSTCTDLMVIGIWENVPGLQELSLSFCSRITDECLLHLCKHQCYRRVPSGCKENGSCSALGKKLRVLDIYCTRISTYGIACGLEHLSSLEYLIQYSTCRKMTHVPLAIILLKDAFIRKDVPFIPLKLKHIDFCRGLIRNSIEELLPVIPHITELKLFGWDEYLEVLTKNFTGSIKSIFLTFPHSDDLDSTIFQDFLVRWSGQLEKLVLSIKQRHLKMRQIVEILRKCKDLKEFWIVGPVRLINKDDAIVPSIIPPSENLRVLHLTKVTGIDVSEQRYFLELMNALKNLKTLEISAFIAENMLSQALEKNSFDNLEKIVINGADVKNVSLERFVNRENDLKQIILIGCTNAEHFVEIHRKVARKQNFSLNILRQVFNRFLNPREILQINKCPV